jgi:hypothetical protein
MTLISSEMPQVEVNIWHLLVECPKLKYFMTLIREMSQVEVLYDTT